MKAFVSKKLMAHALVKSFLDTLDNPTYSSKYATLQLASQMASLYEVEDGCMRNFSVFVSRGRVRDCDDLKVFVAGKSKRYQEFLRNSNISDVDMFTLTNTYQLGEMVGRAVRESAEHYSLNTVLGVWHDKNFLHNFEYILAVKYNDFVVYSTMSFIDPDEKKMSLHMRNVFPLGQVRKNREAVRDLYHDLYKMSASFSLVAELNNILKTDKNTARIEPIDVSNFN